jgi:hypothetical protein
VGGAVRVTGAASATNNGGVYLDWNSGTNLGRVLAGNASSSLLTFSTNYSGTTYERLRIDEFGNVGIGTSSPSEKLEVSGNIKGTQLCIGSDCRSVWPSASVTLSSGGSSDVTITGSGGNLTLTLNTGSSGGASDANKIAKLDASGQFASAMIPSHDMNLLTSGILPISRGGTNSGATLTGNKVMVSSSAAITESAITTDQLGFLSGVSSSIQSQLDTKQSALGFTPVNKAGDSISSLTVTGGLHSGSLSVTGALSSASGGINLLGSTSGSIGLRAPASGSSTVYTLPADAGTNGQVLTTNGVGGLSWATAAGAGFTLTNKTSNDSITTSESFITANAVSASFTLTLPSAVGISGKQLTFKKLDSSSNAVTLVTTASQTIDGSLNYALSGINQAVTVVSDGSNWQVIASVPGGCVHGSQVFYYTGSVQLLNIPSGCAAVTIKAWGAGGAGYTNLGGGGAFGVVSYLQPLYSNSLSIYVGRGGASSTAGGGGGSFVYASGTLLLAVGGGGGGFVHSGGGPGLATTAGGNPVAGGSGGTNGNGGAGGGGNANAGGGGGGGINSPGTDGTTANCFGKQNPGGAPSTVGGGGYGGGAGGAGGAGGGGGGYSGGGGGFGNNTSQHGGGGGGSYAVSGGSLTAGSGATPGGNLDGNYPSGVGTGAVGATAGGNGAVFVSW